MLFPRIKIVPLKTCVAHEGVVPRWVDHIATSIRDEGIVKNPLIVTKARGRHIVIDGMHRFAALKQLEIADVVVYEIDYDDPEIHLAGWDALILRPFKARAFLEKIAASLGARHRIAAIADIAAAQQAVDARRALIAATDRTKRCYVLLTDTHITGDALVKASETADRRLDADGYKPVYVADALAAQDFRRTKAHGLLIRPHYTKAEIIQRTLARKLFPRKSTRHMIPGRPLRVDVGLALLRTKISLAAKNRLLSEHLRWCYEADRVRYYPESVFIFAD